MGLANAAQFGKRFEDQGNGLLHAQVGILDNQARWIGNIAGRQTAT